MCKHLVEFIFTNANHFCTIPKHECSCKKRSKEEGWRLHMRTVTITIRLCPQQTGNIYIVKWI